MPNDSDDKAKKLVKDLEKGFDKLDKQIKKATKKLPRLIFLPELTEKNRKATLAFLKKTAAFERFMGGREAENIGDSVKPQAEWMKALLEKLKPLANQMPWARKMSKLDAEREPAKMAVALKRSQMMMPSKHLALKIKELKKGEGADMDGLNLLPVIIIMYAMIEEWHAAKASKPSG
ncbi:MAG: hypothetical protein WD046_10350 [Paracoccaceae bacterium]